MKRKVRIMKIRIKQVRFNYEEIELKIGKKKFITWRKKDERLKEIKEYGDFTYSIILDFINGKIGGE